MEPGDYAAMQKQKAFLGEGAVASPEQAAGPSSNRTLYTSVLAADSPVFKARPGLHSRHVAAEKEKSRSAAASAAADSSRKHKRKGGGDDEEEEDDGIEDYSEEAKSKHATARRHEPVAAVSEEDTGKESEAGTAKATEDDRFND